MKMRWIMIVMVVSVIIIAMADKGKVFASTADSWWSFNLAAANTSYQRTTYREKETYTSVYVRPTTKTGNLTSVYVRVYGAKNASGSGQTDVTARSTYYFSSPREYTIQNRVKEGGFLYAAIAMRSGGGAGIASGYWSPDTAGTIAEMPYH